MSKVCENRTTIIIAHRLSTVIHANQIIVLNERGVVERGTHQELLNIKVGVYASMWNQQQEAAINENKNEEPDEKLLDLN